MKPNSTNSAKRVIVVAEKSRAYGRALCEGIASFAQEHLALDCDRIQLGRWLKQLEPPWLSDALIYIGNNFAKGINAEAVFRHIGRSHTYRFMSS